MPKTHYKLYFIFGFVEMKTNAQIIRFVLLFRRFFLFVSSFRFFICEVINSQSSCFVLFCFEIYFFFCSFAVHFIRRKQITLDTSNCVYILVIEYLAFVSKMTILFCFIFSFVFFFSSRQSKQWCSFSHQKKFSLPIVFLFLQMSNFFVFRMFFFHFSQFWTIMCRIKRKYSLRGCDWIFYSTHLPNEICFLYA